VEGPLLWFLNRGTGLVALVVLTVVTVLGVLATGGRPGGRAPRFVTQAIHRNLAGLGVGLVVVHVVSAVADEFVDLRWWDALVPFAAGYQRLWTGVGTLALDLLLAVAVSSLVRTRMRHRGWRALHLTAYLLWALSVGHGVGMGTDLDAGLWWLAIACAAAVPAAATWRLVRALQERSAPRPPDPTPAGDPAMTMPIRRIR
jgi:sulfoxide reductase heme-binding subunit YedZ